MNIQEAIKEKTVIHCKTKEEAKRILNMAHELGYKWNDGEDYTCNDKWNKFEDQTYYYLFKGMYAKNAYVDDPNFTIINSTEITDMKQELTITPPSGFEVDEEKSTFQKIVFRRIEKKFPTRLEQIDRPWYISGNGLIFKYEGICRQTPNHFTSKESAEQALKFIKILAFRDVIWEIEGKPENENSDISFRFKTNEGAKHFEKVRKGIELGIL